MVILFTSLLAVAAIFIQLAYLYRNTTNGLSLVEAKLARIECNLERTLET